MKRQRNHTKKLVLEHATVRELHLDELERTAGASVSLIPISDDGDGGSVSFPSDPWGGGSDTNC